MADTDKILGNKRAQNIVFYDDCVGAPEDTTTITMFIPKDMTAQVLEVLREMKSPTTGKKARIYVS